MNQKIWITSIGFVLIIVFGIILNRTGKPYNTIIFTIHKLVALALIVYSFIYVRQLLISYKGELSISRVLLVSIMLVLISILLLFITGALMSIGVLSLKVIRIIHLLSTIILAGGFIKVMLHVGHK